MYEESVPQQPEGSEPESSLVPEPRKRSLGEKIFLGPYGLRAGWRLLIYLLMFTGGFERIVVPPYLVLVSWLPTR